MTDEILKRIDALAAKLGVASDHLWQVLTRQARIEAYEWIAWAILWLIICGAFVLFSAAMFKNKEEHMSDLGIFCAAVALAAFIIACLCVAGTPGQFLNPEYWALQQILKAVSGK